MLCCQKFYFPHCPWILAVKHLENRRMKLMTLGVSICTWGVCFGFHASGWGQCSVRYLIAGSASSLSVLISECLWRHSTGGYKEDPGWEGWRSWGPDPNLGDLVRNSEPQRSSSNFPGASGVGRGASENTCGAKFELRQIWTWRPGSQTYYGHSEPLASSFSFPSTGPRRWLDEWAGGGGSRATLPSLSSIPVHLLVLLLSVTGVHHFPEELWPTLLQF